MLSNFLVKLQFYQLFTLQARIYNKLLIFTYGIKTNARSPLELRSIINEPVSPDAQTEDEILPVLGTYELRGRRVQRSQRFCPVTVTVPSLGVLNRPTSLSVLNRP